MANLVARVAVDRDREAFAALYDHYAPRLAAYLQRLGADPALAEEVAQDAMVALWRKAALFDPAKSSVGTWLYRIARNRRIDLLRRAHGATVELDEAIVPIDDAPQADVAMAASERDGIVRRAMETLPPEQLTLVRLAFFEGRSHSEIAESEGLPLGTVKSRIRLAFSRLRRRLEGDGLVDAK
ncbi:RNA polymerase sigma-70 factor (ECF subfamily) [Methylopila capsulata]|uniref:RNA polymerase sigma factor n=1 Tax=Methylopila capsulata TaxID=61654 RepID=A0A9W6MQJ4_9HYPH|nr:sigma-70 family RNA polymerase sigma factor [Methylopila capsulata]MBM7851670.1 RNA polymerase sigma-70 factor (ECF subfamily) [Methylopila capsulata]GLK54730.1 RNA polymerase sigma factor [Methylopila capsulata]